jgi:VIT1/CCC1 family predicted Fe2+/Mn2+ transporter
LYIQIKMARSHHRKKHKAHVRLYQKSQEGSTTRVRSRKVTGTITIIGAFLGLVLGYFGSGGSIVWIIAGLLAGVTVGFFTGRMLDKEPSR